MLPQEKVATEKAPITSAMDYSARRYSFRRSAATTAKLMLIAGSVIGLLWMLDILVTS